ncbi:DUF1120 domain-containing protein [Providencia manganoxydans]|uniref:DUF1120 domain-containing protein n=1 Tax=Providencia manganoxydans TaxID=2923283 RepID=UPI0032DA81AF
MFKKSLLAIALVSMSSAALSATTANLKVIGTITPPTCTINADTNAVVEYTFNISPDLFPSDGSDYKAPSETKNIEIVCDASTYLSFDSTDERDDSIYQAGDNNFGLGTFGSNNSKIGFYTVTMKNATVKENPTANAENVGISTNASTYNTSALLSKSKTMAWAKSVNNLAQGQIFAADFMVTPTFNKSLRTTPDKVSFDGSAVLTFGFSI